MPTSEPTPRLALTTGEPAGVGPDLLLRLAQQPIAAQRVAIGNPALLEQRARQLRLPLRIVTFAPDGPRAPTPPGTLELIPVPVAAPVHCGVLDPANAEHVLTLLETAAAGCIDGLFDAMVTGPVHKEVIHRAGYAFTGHTEWLAERAGGCRPVMMLTAGSLRVALATTHLPLRAVPDAITPALLEEVITILDHDLRSCFDIDPPRIAVCGLNPHAGEHGVLGTEECSVIIPVLDTLRARGIDLRGPLPADTAFTPRALAEVDAVLALYHDQGLPVLKHAGFGRAVNVTLGLPFIRTSVDHGTALDLAGSGSADPGSFLAAEALARELVVRRRHAGPDPVARGPRAGT
ncbi:4-hydroxythreonine-4-phosphate dehydrogenase [Thioalkalivibrio nitratireducens DSM 14787]|uniref:4-hydroxythreonine-4-phosphate dehydrogenase n=1 Tax=Thioalkalivibrio nitratireducens (strain DSM 14787 / UNIQEM 213 / ALEN2) TaxID=1255043 RepID=L0DWB4_THIND|nr:4-hydroxythreonine-4-phosphate dehydrogenase PdxA [Thioalkalivibrio nitratireducens]AGA33864.1 4-hydroxythreonine-4-phosphate dehydrogenase [Thioalkalivibrio nitratireducens DSM 14787]